jgi:murein DD-endopeptidase MepM/ murein hydrolase activator NlpD
MNKSSFNTDKSQSKKYDLPHQYLAKEYFPVRNIWQTFKVNNRFTRHASSKKTWKLLRLGKNKYLEVAKNNPVASAIATFIFFVGSVVIVSETNNFFTASLTDKPSPLAFDGTTYPFKKSPDWFKVGGKNIRSYDNYSSSELVSAPRYNLSKMQKEGWVQDIVNTKITYPIVYMGKYKFDHKENTGSHPAIDIKLAPKTPVYSIANGIVIKSESLSYGYGQHIVIRHDKVPEYGTLYSSYSHLSLRNVKIGDIVHKGDIIGKVGDTGNATTAHIHFQVDKSSAPFHPYWPFTTKDASASGYTFFTAVNAGFGKQNALKHTIHPFKFIHKYENNYNIVAENNIDKDTDVIIKTKQPTPIPTIEKKEVVLETIKPKETKQEVLSGFRVEATPLKILEGEKIKVSILAKNSQGNFFESFSDIVKIKYPGKNKNEDIVESIKIIDGEGTAILPLFLLGDNKIIVSYKNVIETVHVEVLKRKVINTNVLEFSEENILTENIKEDNLSNIEEPQSEKKDNTVKIFEEEKSDFTGTFSHFEFSGANEVKKGESIDIMLRAVDTNGKAIVSKFFPEKGVFIAMGKNGKINPVKVTKGDLKDGVMKFTFKGEIVGRGFIKLHDTVFNIKVIDTLETNNITKNIFTDIPKNHPNAKALAYLKEQNIISGYPDGSFQSDKIVNRSEALKMILEALNVSIKKNLDNPFNDVSKKDWFVNYILSAYDKKIVSGYNDGFFRPEKPVSRSEYFKILINTAGINLSGIPKKNPFIDVERTSWFAEFAEFAKKEKLLDFGNNFLPSQKVKRGEVAESIYRLIK